MNVWNMTHDIVEGDNSVAGGNILFTEWRDGLIYSVTTKKTT